MQTFKRKLEKLHTEEESLHDHSAKRIRHLQDLYDIPSLADQKYEEWSRTRLDRLVVDYLLRSGYSRTATSLAHAKQISHLIDLDVFISCHKIASSLQSAEPREALAWINENKSQLKKLTPSPYKTTDLEFELRLQQYIELIRLNTTSKKLEAQQFAITHLAPHASSRRDRIMQVAGLLAQSPETIAEPYASLFAHSRWDYLSNLFISTHHTLLSLPTQPLLHVALSAGLSALKTPACHSVHNPASSATPGHARMSTSSSLCPICSMELNELARNVPYAHHTTSSVEVDPVVLPNGRIYGKGRLEELQRKLLMASGAGGGFASGVEEGKDGVRIGETGEVRDPTTGESFGWEEVRKVYIT
jgi:macrophage erythroblast attacher